MTDYLTVADLGKLAADQLDDLARKTLGTTCTLMLVRGVTLTEAMLTVATETGATYHAVQTMLERGIELITPVELAKILEGRGE